MPACTTPELWPVWWAPTRSSRSTTRTVRSGSRSSASRATARPRMPAPTMTRSLLIPLSRHAPADLADELLEGHPRHLRRQWGRPGLRQAGDRVDLEHPRLLVVEADVDAREVAAAADPVRMPGDLLHARPRRVVHRGGDDPRAADGVVRGV